MSIEKDWPCWCLNEEQNEHIVDIRDQIHHNYGIKLTTSQIISKAVQFYLDCHFGII